MKTLVALAEVVGLVPIIDSGPQPSTTPVLGDPMPSLISAGSGYIHGHMGANANEARTYKITKSKIQQKTIFFCLFFIFWRKPLL